VPVTFFYSLSFNHNRNRKMAEVDLQEVHDFLLTVAKKAGHMITTLRPQQEIGNKKNSVDLVTEVDQAVEKMVTETCQEAYPHFDFMGEETYKPGDKLTDAPTFIVDPIDGEMESLQLNVTHLCQPIGH